MVQMQTYLNVADNSGAKVQCIKARRSQMIAAVGDIIVVAVKDAQRSHQEKIC